MAKPTRFQCLTALAERVAGEDVVVSALGETEALWHALTPARPGNFYIRNGMSMPTSVALGLAIAQPGRRIWALEGDGGMLMNLGSLATIASQRPPNLRILVFVNRLYLASGGQQLPASVDFALLARGSGLEAVFQVREYERVNSSFDELVAATGPALLACEIQPAAHPSLAAPPIPHPQEFKRAFARFLHGS